LHLTGLNFFSETENFGFSAQMTEIKNDEMWVQDVKFSGKIKSFKPIHYK